MVFFIVPSGSTLNSFGRCAADIDGRATFGDMQSSPCIGHTAKP